VNEALELRKAARLMRERAWKATTIPGRWERNWAFYTHFVVPGDATNIAADNVARLKPQQRAAAEHIASWDPDMAMLLANILDSAAGQLEDAYGRKSRCDEPGGIDMALDIARTYMRSGS
jgi:hypothetical protein